MTRSQNLDPHGMCGFFLLQRGPPGGGCLQSGKRAWLASLSAPRVSALTPPQMASQVFQSTPAVENKGKKKCRLEKEHVPLTTSQFLKLKL